MITLGVVESRTDDDHEVREKRGLQGISIRMKISNGEDTVGLTTNDRITSYNKMMMTERSSGKIRGRSAHNGGDSILLQEEIRAVLEIQQEG